jgi:hypothetical protein
MIDLDAIEKLLAEATPGPWARGFQHESTIPVVARPPGREEEYGFIDALAHQPAILPPDLPPFVSHERYRELERNLDLVVALRNAAPQLIALARAGSRLADAVADLGDPERIGIPLSLRPALAAFREAQGEVKP